MRGRKDAPQARSQQAQKRAVVALRRRMRPHSRHRPHRDHDPPSCLRARTPRQPTVDAAHLSTSKVAGREALAAPPMRSHCEAPGASVGPRTASTSHEAPNSSTSRGAAKFGDGATHDPHRFWRFLRVQSSTDRDLGGRPPFGSGVASQHAVWAACENVEKRIRERIPESVNGFMRRCPLNRRSMAYR